MTFLVLLWHANQLLVTGCHELSLHNHTWTVQAMQFIYIGIFVQSQEWREVMGLVVACACVCVYVWWWWLLWYQGLNSQKYLW